MSGMRWILAAGLGCVAAGAFVACASSGASPVDASDDADGGVPVGDAGGVTKKDAGSADASAPPDDDAGLVVIVDAKSDAPIVTPDAACAAVTEDALTEPRPVDIIWMVDNSVSMAPTVAEVQAGLNAFADGIGASKLDYKVILLSLRNKTSPITVSGKTRFPVCIPPPLAGDDACGDGPRFAHANLDVLSLQTLEQILGTLGQTAGYAAGEDKGGEAWQQQLRPNATKTFVLVTDDNARLAAGDFETFPGGTNPFNGLKLPPGILDSSWKGAFDGYVFSAIYGWGSDVDPGEKCTYADQSQPPSSGWTYSTLVTKTGGARAKICDGHAAWQPFYVAVSKAVLAATKVACDVAIPAPDGGALDPGKVNVQITGPNGATTLAKVAGPGACGPAGGWYYDDDKAPTRVVLCPISCKDAQASVGLGKPGHVEVLFGCETVLK